MRDARDQLLFTFLDPGGLRGQAQPGATTRTATSSATSATRPGMRAHAYDLVTGGRAFAPVQPAGMFDQSRFPVTDPDGTGARAIVPPSATKRGKDDWLLERSTALAPGHRGAARHAPAAQRVDRPGRAPDWCAPATDGTGTAAPPSASTWACTGSTPSCSSTARSPTIPSAVPPWPPSWPTTSARWQARGDRHRLAARRGPRPDGARALRAGTVASRDQLVPHAARSRRATDGPCPARPWTRSSSAEHAARSSGSRRRREVGGRRRRPRQGHRPAGAGGDRLRRARPHLGTPYDDRLSGREGDDVIRGLGGDDVIYSGLDERPFSDDRLVGGSGADRIFAGRGHDEVSVDPARTSCPRRSTPPCPAVRATTGSTTQAPGSAVSRSSARVAGTTWRCGRLVPPRTR